MIRYRDILSKYPWATIIAYHKDNEYHYAVWKSTYCIMVLQMPHTAMDINTHIVCVESVTIESLHLYIYMHENIKKQLHLYVTYFDKIIMNSLRPQAVVDNKYHWSVLSKSFGVPPVQSVMYLGPASFADKEGNIDWSTPYQLDWS